MTIISRPDSNHNSMPEQKKLVQFGAGKIGRSFIAQVFYRGGFETVFVDIDPGIVTLLNQKKQYRVVIKSDKGDKTHTIQNVRAILFSDSETIVRELSDATVACLSVGQKGLPATLPLIAKALEKRYQQYGLRPLDVIIAENIRNADSIILEAITPMLPTDFPVAEMLGLVETSIGKMVPIMTRRDLEEDPLQVFAEPYNSLIVSKKGFKGVIPQVPDLQPKENIKAWVDRKLFIHNLGHSSLAYFAFAKDPSMKFIYQAAQDKELYRAAYDVMQQSAKVLLRMYPEEFTKQQLTLHIIDLLERFGNKALGDTIFRIGCDLYRKFGPHDRFATPVAAAVKHNLPYDLLLKAMRAGMKFRSRDENGNFHPSDQEFFKEAEKGFNHILANISHLPHLLPVV